MTQTFDTWTAVVLAAGQGTRMRSQLRKVLHPLAGRPMIRYVVDAARALGVARCIVVVGPDADDVREATGAGAEFAVQDQPLGTGHALAAAKDAIGDAEHVLVLNGDVPLITEKTLRTLAGRHLDTAGDLTFLTADVDSAGGYGCVQRDADGNVTDIIEARERENNEAVRNQKAEINAGQYCFRASWLWQQIESIPVSSGGERYLTSLVTLAARNGAALAAVTAADATEVQGINDLAQLAEAESAMRRRLNHAHMLAGVTLVDPERTYIDAAVEIGPDSVIQPNTHLRGATAIGSGCVIGPDSTVVDTTIGADCSIISSTVEDAALETASMSGLIAICDPGPISAQACISATTRKLRHLA